MLPMMSDSLDKPTVAPDPKAQASREMLRFEREVRDLRKEIARLQDEIRCATAAHERAVYRWHSYERSPINRVVGMLRGALYRGKGMRTLRIFVKGLQKGYGLSFRQAREVVTIIDSGLFDEVFYLQQYPEVKDHAMPPVVHFVIHGVGEGFKPHPLFDTAFYLAKYPDVEPNDINPLVHFVEIAERQRRMPNPNFDPFIYLADHPEVFNSNINPLLHYIQNRGDEADSAGEADEPGSALPEVLQANMKRLKACFAHPNRERKTPDSPYDPEHIQIHWIVPDFRRGEGGIMNILRAVAFLESFGHRNTLWIQRLQYHATAEAVLETINRHFTPLAIPVGFLPDDPGEITGDAVIATDRMTAFAARAVSAVRGRFYFVQDFEPLFYPTGSESFLSESTYGFGFDCLCNGEWLATIMREKFGAWACTWHQAFDPAYYFADKTIERTTNHIAFYSRYGTPRRAVELGLLAFEKLSEQHAGEFHVDFFGEPIGKLDVPYGYTDHGILSQHDLGNLYRQATVGAVFSATNYSIITREMMACELPVVDLDIESVRAVYPADCLALAQPVPGSIADTLDQLLSSSDERARLVKNANIFIEQFSWETSARIVEAGIRERVAD